MAYWRIKRKNGIENAFRCKPALHFNIGCPLCLAMLINFALLLIIRGIYSELGGFAGDGHGIILLFMLPVYVAGILPILIYINLGITGYALTVDKALIIKNFVFWERVSEFKLEQVGSAQIHKIKGGRYYEIFFGMQFSWCKMFSSPAGIDYALKSFEFCNLHHADLAQLTYLMREFNVHYTLSED